MSLRAPGRRERIRERKSAGLAFLAASTTYEENHEPASGAGFAASSIPQNASYRAADGSEVPSDSPGGLTQ